MFGWFRRARSRTSRANHGRDAGGQRGVEHLEGDVAPELPILGEIDGGGSALAHAPHQTVPVGDRLDERCRCVHPAPPEFRRREHAWGQTSSDADSTSVQAGPRPEAAR